MISRAREADIYVTSTNPNAPTYASESINRFVAAGHSIFDRLMDFTATIKVAQANRNIELAQRKLQASDFEAKSAKAKGEEYSPKYTHDMYLDDIRKAHSTKSTVGLMTLNPNLYMESSIALDTLNEGLKAGKSGEEIIESMNSAQEDQTESQVDPQNEMFDEFTDMVLQSEEQVSQAPYGSSLFEPIRSLVAQGERRRKQVIQYTLANNTALRKLIVNNTNNVINRHLSDIQSAYDVSPKTQGIINKVRNELIVKDTMNLARKSLSTAGFEGDKTRKQYRNKLAKSIDDLPFFHPLRDEAKQLMHELQYAEEKSKRARLGG